MQAIPQVDLVALNSCHAENILTAQCLHLLKDALRACSHFPCVCRYAIVQVVLCERLIVYDLPARDAGHPLVIRLLHSPVTLKYASRLIPCADRITHTVPLPGKSIHLNSLAVPVSKLQPFNLVDYS
jgi:hypothetical protein